jgi:hypothetical protein
MASRRNPFEDEATSARAALLRRLIPAILQSTSWDFARLWAELGSDARTGLQTQIDPGQTAGTGRSRISDFLHCLLGGTDIPWPHLCHVLHHLGKGSFQQILTVQGITLPRYVAYMEGPAFVMHPSLPKGTPLSRLLGLHSMVEMGSCCFKT